MTLISSRMTFFYKRVFPIIWFGMLALFLVGPFLFGSWSGQPSQPMFFIVPIVMMVAGYFMMKKMRVFAMADQVFDVGDALLVKNGTQQQQIPLSDIANVGYTAMMNPPLITLSLRRPTSFGDKVTFCAPVSLMPSLKASPVIDELIRRVDAARRRARN